MASTEVFAVGPVGAHRWTLVLGRKTEPGTRHAEARAPVSVRHNGAAQAYAGAFVDTAVAAPVGSTSGIHSTGRAVSGRRCRRQEGSVRVTGATAALGPSVGSGLSAAVDYSLDVPLLRPRRSRCRCRCNPYHGWGRRSDAFEILWPSQEGQCPESEPHRQPRPTLSA